MRRFEILCPYINCDGIKEHSDIVIENFKRAYHSAYNTHPHTIASFRVKPVQSVCNSDREWVSCNCSSTSPSFFCSTTYPISTVHLLISNIMLSIFRDDSGIYIMHLMPLISFNNNSFFINNVSSLSLTRHQHTFIRASCTLCFTINFISLYCYVFADLCETDERTTNFQNDDIQLQHRPCIWGTEHRLRAIQYPAWKKSWKEMTTT
jgi:hypothetical protein